MTDLPPSGPAAAVIVSASAGCLALGLLTLVADASPSAKAVLTVWKPTGPLSGVSDGAIAVWLILWLVLSIAWKGRDIGMRGVAVAASGMIAAALLLTFPPTLGLLLKL